MNPWFVQVSRPAYFCIAVVCVVEVAMLLATPFTINAWFLLAAYGFLIWITGSGLLAARYGFTKIGGALQGIALLHIIGALLFVATVFGAAVSGPFVDHTLARADAALGLDWPAMFRIFQETPWLVSASRIAYRMFHVEIVLIPAMLFLAGQIERGWRLVMAWGIASLATALIFPLTPAIGPASFYGFKAGDVPNLFISYPWTMGPVIEGIRAGQRHELAGMLTGLVSFPSFHAASGVLFAWAVWPMRWLRWPLLFINVAMIAATPFFGSHYFVDVLAGAFVGAFAIRLSGLEREREGGPTVTGTGGRLAASPRGGVESA